MIRRGRDGRSSGGWDGVKSDCGRNDCHSVFDMKENEEKGRRLGRGWHFNDVTKEQESVSL